MTGVSHRIAVRIGRMMWGRMICSDDKMVVLAQTLIVLESDQRMKRMVRELVFGGWQEILQNADDGIR